MNLKNPHLFPPTLKTPRSLQHLLKLLSLISTSVTTSITTKLFITPIKINTPKKEMAMQKSAQNHTLEIPSIHKKINILTYGYSKKKVLLVHGWCGRSTQLFMIANKLLEKGYMVVSFDGPSHGKSEGKTTAMPEFIEAIKEIETKFGPFESAIGHSFGGMALYNLAADNFAINSLISIGSGDLISDIILNFTDNLGLKPKIGIKMKQKFDRIWQRDIDQHSPSKLTKNIKIPTLVIHDSNDGDVPVSCATNIRQNLVNGELYITQGLGHTKILYHPKVINTIVNFIIRNT